MRSGLCILVLLSVGSLAAQPSMNFSKPVVGSYEKLIHYVDSTFSDKSSIAEFFYYWMAENVQYDYDIGLVTFIRTN